MKGGFLLKFKLFSLVLLLVCFAFLGILTGVIPTAEQDAASVFRFLDQDGTASTQAPSPSAGPSASPRAALAPPSPRLAGTAAPVSTEILTGSTDEPGPTGEPPSPAPTARPVAVSAASAAPKPAAEPEPTVKPEPTAEPRAAAKPSPTAPPATEAPAPTAAIHGWEPDAEVVSTTITWHDPLQNDTDIPVDGAELLGKEPQLVLPAQGYQILIIHTHGTEAYTPDGPDQYQATADYRTTDTEHTVIQVGLALGKALEEYGLRVLVDTELYDWPSYNGSYSRSEQAIRQYLEKYPSIAMIIDLHRAALGDEEMVYKTVSDQVEPAAAQMMFVIGTDASLTHPNWRENLALALSLQGLVEEEYPHLMRPTLVCPYRYNQQFTTGSVLLEIGTAGNTLQEAVNAAELFAGVVGPVLAGRVAPDA